MIRTAFLAACLLGAVLPAEAGERPSVAGDTARACPGYGPGFVQVPGTTTCIRIGGRVASEYGASARRVGRDDIAGFRTTGRMSADIRTETDYGPVRAYVRARAASDGRADRR